ncbi:hypothetical protein HK102_009936 [Quaeritorhiza haematococci]|nr:hypothetical protein HK102_009936 [Quaeritorhiza haematococci]
MKHVVLWVFIYFVAIYATLRTHAYPNQLYERQNDGADTKVEPAATTPLTNLTVPNRWILRLKSKPIIGPVGAKQAAAVVSAIEMDRVKDITAQIKGAQLERQIQIGLNFRAYFLSGPPSMATALRKRPDVAYVEPDAVAKISAIQTTVPSWGLARIAQRQNSQASTYAYPDSAGYGVDVYVIDTGIKIEHPDFQGRAKWGISFVENGSRIDGNGHGTHVAGTVAGLSFGVAKKASVIAVRVLDSSGSGTNTAVISGIEWVIGQAQASGRPSVINLSLGSAFSYAVNDAVNAAVLSGVYVVSAAGNSAQDACYFSPASASGSFTVGASDAYDYLAYFSNWGSCLDIVAPGVDIRSADINGAGALPSRADSGTSMAAPHVAGVLALILGEQRFTSVEAGYNYIRSLGTNNNAYTHKRGYGRRHCHLLPDIIFRVFDLTALISNRIRVPVELSNLDFLDFKVDVYQFADKVAHQLTDPVNFFNTDFVEQLDFLAHSYVHWKLLSYSANEFRLETIGIANCSQAREYVKNTTYDFDKCQPQNVTDAYGYEGKALMYTCVDNTDVEKVTLVGRKDPYIVTTMYNASFCEDGMGEYASGIIADGSCRPNGDYAYRFTCNGGKFKCFYALLVKMTLRDTPMAF